MPGLHRTPEGLGTDLQPKNGQTRGYSAVGRQGRMFLLCYSPEWGAGSRPPTPGVQPPYPRPNFPSLPPPPFFPIFFFFLGYLRPKLGAIWSSLSPCTVINPILLTSAPNSDFLPPPPAHLIPAPRPFFAKSPPTPDPLTPGPPTPLSSPTPEGHKLLLNTRNNSGLLAIEIIKLHCRF